MNSKQIDNLIIVLLILMVLALNYNLIDSFLEKTFSARQEAFVERIIDGDTIVSTMGNIRFLGINTPEKGETYYQEAKDFLKKTLENQTVQLEFKKQKYDKYGRTLAYVFLQNENINVKMVENGLANYYFYDGKDIYSGQLENAWQVCLKNRNNLCEPSTNTCSPCISIENPRNSIINICKISCDITNWTIKGEGRERFAFLGILESGQRAKFKLDLANSSGSLFLRDEKGKLVLWKKD